MSFFQTFVRFQPVRIVGILELSYRLQVWDEAKHMMYLSSAFILILKEG